MQDTVKVTLSPLLADEIYAHTVETALVDHRGGNPLGQLTNVEVTLYEKIERAGRNGFTLKLSLDEAKVLYDDLFYLEDVTLQWAGDETDEWGRPNGIRWYSVNRSISRHLAKLRAFGVKVNEHGWAHQ